MKSYEVRTNCEYVVVVEADDSDSACKKAGNIDYAEWDKAWAVYTAEETDEEPFDLPDPDSCGCPGCDVCGSHCIPGCPSGDGEECTVAPTEDDMLKNLGPAMRSLGFSDSKIENTRLYLSDDQVWDDEVWDDIADGAPDTRGKDHPHWVEPTREVEPASFVMAHEDKAKLRNIAKQLFSGNRVSEEDRHTMAEVIHGILDNGMTLSDEDIERLFPGGD